MPSYFGSKVQSLPAGISVPTEASMGSRAPAPSALAEAVRAAEDGAAAFLRAGARFGGGASSDGVALDARLERQTFLRLFAAISSIVRPETTDVISSATMSEPGLEYSSRCLMRSHCGFSSAPRRVRTSTHEPCILSLI